MESRCTTEQQRRLFNKRVIVPRTLLLQRGTVNQLARFGDAVRKACTQGCYVAGLLLTDMQKANTSCDWRSMVALKKVPECNSTHIVPYSCVKAASMRVEGHAWTPHTDQGHGLASLLEVKPQPWYASDRSFNPHREAFVGVHLNIDVDWIAFICHKAPPNWLWDAQGSISLGLFEARGPYAGFVRASVITPFVRQMQHLFNGSLSGKPVVVATPLGKTYKESAWILREFEAEVARVLGVRVISGSSRLTERELNALADLHVLGHSKAFLGWLGSTFSRFVEEMLPAGIPVAKFVARSGDCARHVRQSSGDDRFEQLNQSFHAAAKRTAAVRPLGGRSGKLHHTNFAMTSVKMGWARGHEHTHATSTHRHNRETSPKSPRVRQSQQYSQTACNGAVAGFEYRASWLEREWTTRPIDTGGNSYGICTLARSPAQQQGVAQWLKYSQRSYGRSKPPGRLEGDVLSWMSCSDRRDPIEPLTGVARHPRAPIGCADTTKEQVRANEFLYDLSHLVLHNECGGGARAPPGRKNLFFDLGSGGMSKAPVNLQHGAGHFSSVPLFSELYTRNCIHFHSLYAWEAKPVSEVSYWDKVPAHLSEKLYFFNEPVRYVSSEPAGFNALRTLQAIARPIDFVALKVDIDTPSVEVPLMEAILNSEALLGLIDEVFFEYHFKVRPDFGWGNRMNATVNDALRLMQRLRMQGVRAHFWV